MNRKNKWVMIVACMMAIILIYMLGFFLPALRRLNNIKAEVNSEVSKSGTTGEQIVAATNLSSAIKNAGQELGELKERIPDVEAKLDILHSIEKMIRQADGLSNVSIRIIGTGGIIENVIEKQTIEIGFDGSFEQTARFLFDVTHLRNIATIEDVIISSKMKGRLYVKAVIACYFMTAKK